MLLVLPAPLRGPSQRLCPRCHDEPNRPKLAAGLEVSRMSIVGHLEAPAEGWCAPTHVLVRGSTVTAEKAGTQLPAKAYPAAFLLCFPVFCHQMGVFLCLGLRLTVLTREDPGGNPYHA